MAEQKAGERSHPVLHYYLQDELGSPVRVSGYDKDYLAYGYDEFGNDLYSDLEEAGIPNPYSRQGEEQPFGYTGYRYDDISGTYFAQAREYQPQNGRFTAEDVIKGNGAVPETLNRYGYCLGNPVGLVDLDGMNPYPAWLYGIYAHIQFESEFMALYQEEEGTMARENTYGKINVYIPGGGRTGGKGFADLVLYDEGNVEIYEIKPISYYGTGKGDEQLDRYVQAYEALGSNVKKGSIENVEVLLWWENDTYNYDSEMNIKYEMFEDSPGMIYYTLSYKDPEKQPGYVKQPIKYAELDEDMEKYLLYLASLTTAGAITYATLEKGLNKAINRAFPFFLVLPEDIKQNMFRYGSGGDCPMS